MIKPCYLFFLRSSVFFHEEAIENCNIVKCFQIDTPDSFISRWQLVLNNNINIRKLLFCVCSQKKFVKNTRGQLSGKRRRFCQVNNRFRVKSRNAAVSQLQNSYLQAKQGNDVMQRNKQKCERNGKVSQVGCLS